MGAGMKKLLSGLFIASAVLVLILASSILYHSNDDCTIFTFEKDGEVLFGSNEDWHSADLYLGVFPRSEEGFGSMHYGYTVKNDQISFASAINEYGLMWSINSIPKRKLNDHTERPYSHEADNYFTSITKKAKTVEDAIRLAGEFDFGSSIGLQIHIGDASGDAVVISPDADGELVFTRKAQGDGYLISTNFNRIQIEKSEFDWRYRTADRMLGELEGENLNERAGKVLDAVSLDTLTTFTMISTVSDLKNGNILIYYMSQFDNPATIRMEDAFAGGERIVKLDSLFDKKTVNKGNAEYRSFERRFNVAKVVVVVLGIGLVMLGAAYGIRKHGKGRE